jgi:YebC/PmpR family DNA-binding regulatory protein
MSGHSKWSTIKRKKGIKDQERGKIFTKISRTITVAVIEGGGIGDPDKNIRLRMALEKAKDANMPKDTVARAIEKATSPDRNHIKEVVYEAFAPYGVALLIEATTDNANRTHAEVKNMLDRHGGKMGAQGSVAYLFHKCGTLVFDKKNITVDEVLPIADALSMIDIEEDDESIVVYIPFDQVGHAASAVGNIPVEGPQIDYKPNAPVDASTLSEAQAQKIQDIIDTVENLDDVHHVYTNLR